MRVCGCPAGKPMGLVHEFHMEPKKRSRGHGWETLAVCLELVKPRWRRGASDRSGG